LVISLVIDGLTVRPTSPDPRHGGRGAPEARSARWAAPVPDPRAPPAVSPPTGCRQPAAARTTPGRAPPDVAPGGGAGTIRRGGDGPDPGFRGVRRAVGPHAGDRDVPP